MYSFDTPEAGKVGTLMVLNLFEAGLQFAECATQVATTNLSELANDFNPDVRWLLSECNLVFVQRGHCIPDTSMCPLPRCSQRGAGRQHARADTPEHGAGFRHEPGVVRCRHADASYSVRVHDGYVR